MKITVNYIPEEINKTTMTVSELLEVKNFTFKMLIIKINGKLIDKKSYDTTGIVEGDDVQVIHLISGG